MTGCAWCEDRDLVLADNEDEVLLTIERIMTGFTPKNKKQELIEEALLKCYDEIQEIIDGKKPHCETTERNEARKRMYDAAMKYVK